MLIIPNCNMHFKKHWLRLEKSASEHGKVARPRKEKRKI